MGCAGEGGRSWSQAAFPPVGGVFPIRQPRTSTQRRRSSFINSSSCVDGKQKFGSSVAFTRTLARPLGRRRETELLFYPRVGGFGGICQRRGVEVGGKLRQAQRQVAVVFLLTLFFF